MKKIFVETKNKSAMAVTTSNQRGVFFLTGDIVKALTVCVVLGIMFFVNASDLYSVAPNKIKVTCEMPCTHPSKHSCADYKGVNIHGHGGTIIEELKNVYDFGLETGIIAYRTNVFIPDDQESDTISKIGIGYINCPVFYNDITTNGDTITAYLPGADLPGADVIEIRDYDEWLEMSISWRNSLIGKPKRIAHLVNGNVVMDIPADTIKSFLIQTITPINPNIGAMSIDSVYVQVFTDTNIVYLVFNRLTDTSCKIISFVLEEDDGDIYPPLAYGGSKETNTCTGDPCKKCYPYDPKTGCDCEITADFKILGRCNHSVSTTNLSVFLVDNAYSWNYAAFCNLVNNYGGISEPEEKPEPEFELLDSVRLNNIRDLILLDVEKKIRTLRKESFAGAEGFDIKANFANDLLNFNIETETSATATLDIYDISGIKIGTRTFDLSQGTNAYSYSTSAYTSGTYLYSISIDGNLLFDGQFTIVR